MANLKGKRVLVVVGDDYEDLELWYPLLRLIEAGAEAVTAGPAAGAVYRGKHGYPCESAAALAEQRSTDYDGVVLPGGWMPDKLRRDPHLLKLVREFAAAGKLVAAICHGPWIAISAGVCRGVRMTGSAGIKDDLVNAGAEWADQPVVVDRHFISARRPPDLPPFAAAIVEFLGRR